MGETVVEVREFRKVYGDVVAVDDISFQVQRGEVFGLLGPNGAGKTSTLESLEGLRSPDGGDLRILGVDPSRQPARLRNLIGVQLQTSGLPASMTVAEAMAFFAAYHGVASQPRLLERLGLSEKRGTQYRDLSTGLQRRLALALAMLHEPAVVFLDEPTAGLDVPSRAELHNLVRELQSSGKTVILATHDMAEAEKLSDRVAILLGGRVVASGTPRDLTAAGGSVTKVSVRTEADCLSANGAIFPGVTQSSVKGEYVVYFTNDPGPTVSALLARIESKGDRLVDLRVERPSLEERFLEITNGGSR
jgi:ABC-2 type transport system ATP-binding protein